MMQAIADDQGSTASNQFYTVEDHYNIGLRKCFVELYQSTINADGTTMRFVSIWDAVENQVVARCITNSPSGTPSNSCEELAPDIDRFSTLQGMQGQYMKN
jgi:hypothetical protein